jgi:hypothetical protein
MVGLRFVGVWLLRAGVSRVGGLVIGRTRLLQPVPELLTFGGTEGCSMLAATRPMAFLAS